MKKSSLFAAVVASIFLCFKLSAQSLPPGRQEWKCGTDELMKLNLKLDPGLPDRIKKMQKAATGKSGGNNSILSTPSFVIPVVFHVVQNGSTPVFVPTYDQVLWQLASLNAGFANNLDLLDNITDGPQAVDTKISFCLAKYTQASGGPTAWPNGTPGMMTYSTVDPLVTNVDGGSVPSLNALAALTNYVTDFPPDMYLNIFCVPDLQMGGVALAGMGTFPWMTLPIKGIIMRDDCIGNNTYGTFPNMYASLDKGNVLSHEAGHYLGLFHTFETYYNALSVTSVAGGVGCWGSTNPTTEGDLIYDTPPTLINSPAIPYNSCFETYAPYGAAADEFDQRENIMSYSDDEDLNTFTAKQAERMWATLDNSYFGYFVSGDRTSLWQPSNLNATGVTISPSCGPGLLTSAFTFTFDLSTSTCSTVPFSFYTPSLPVYLNATTFYWDFGDGNTSTLQNPTHTYTFFPTDYTVTLTTSDGISTSTTTMAIVVPETVPRIVGQSGVHMEVCKGTEQTILIMFPITCTMAVITDGTTTYTVINNRPHVCMGPTGVYIMPFTFPISASGTWALVPSSCGVLSLGTADFTVRDCCSSLVRNGDFELGPVGFYSAYTINSSYSTSHSPGFASADVVPASGNTTKQLFFDSDMYTAFPSLGQCTDFGTKKLLAGQNMTGFLPSTDYYVAFKVNESEDSVIACGPNKFNFRLFNTSLSINLLDENIVPCTYPAANCASPKGPIGYHVFCFKITTPAGITGSTPLTLELKEMDHSLSHNFDYIFDDIMVRRILPPTAPPSPVLSVAGPTPACYPSTFTVSATGAPTVTWQPGGSTSLTFTVSPSGGSQTTYSASFDNGICLLTNTITVIQPPPIEIVAYNSTFCTNSSSNTVISATVYPTSIAATYTWEPGGLIGQTQTVIPSSTTIYTVTATTPWGCTLEAQPTVYVTANCCPPSFTAPVMPSSLSGGVVTGPRVILNDLTINPSTGLTKFVGEFAIAAGVKITVKPGNEFWLNQAHLYSCGTTMWQGIVLEDGSQVSSNANTLVEDAIIAIDAENVSTSHYGYVLEVSQTTFNKNYISVKLAGTTGLSDLQTFLIADVFTSRDLPFTTTTWPGAGMTSPDLRYAGGPLTDLISPYLLQGYTPVNLKLPYSSQPAHIGVQISDFGDVAASLPSPGVIIGHTSAANSFNLFDNIGTGIEVTNSNLTTFNNVFQNLRYYSTSLGMSGGTGIKHSITSLMNTGLFLSPPAGQPTFINYFWNCYTGVDATNVYQLEADYQVIRSTHDLAGYASGSYLPGNTGITLSTNRFSSNIRFGDFNNIQDAIKLNFNSGNYDFSGGLQTGVYGGDFNVTENYFGAQVDSSTPLSNNEYMLSAVTVNAPAVSGWQSNGGSLFINSNKVNRAFNAMSVDGMNGHHTEISGNVIDLEDDILANPQYGVQILKTKSSVVAGSNAIIATGISNTNISAFYSSNNSGTRSPYITCNAIKNAYTAFTFNGPNKGTVWNGNKMQNHNYGLLLVNNAVIGQQGSASRPSDNQWLGTWSSPPYHTYVISSNSASSPLWVKSAFPFNPTDNGSTISGQDYTSTGSIFITTGNGNYSCPGPTLQPAPNYRSSNANNDVNTGISETSHAVTGFEIFPNPASDHLIITGENQNGQVQLTIIDIAGKVLSSRQVNLTGNKAYVTLDVEEGVYMIELVNDKKQKTIKKLVIVK